MDIRNVKIYGVEESIVASGYPMRTNLPEDMGSPSEQRRKKACDLASSAIGSGHDNYLNGIIVQFDLTCSVKMWQQMQRYHFVDFVSSASTVHRLAKMDLHKAYNKWVDTTIINHMVVLQEAYEKHPTHENFLRLIYNNPVGMDLTARLTTNARQLKTIYSQRKAHKLDEWREFCEWVLSLPVEVHPWSEGRV